MTRNRRLPVGAEVLSPSETHCRVWAPSRRRVEVVTEGKPNAILLEPDGAGYFAGCLAVGPGSLYRFRLDGGPQAFPDPASRFQPSGPHGPSQVIDPRRFSWTDRDWPGVGLEGQVIYEMH